MKYDNDELLIKKHMLTVKLTSLAPKGSGSVESLLKEANAPVSPAQMEKQGQKPFVPARHTGNEIHVLELVCLLGDLTIFLVL